MLIHKSNRGILTDSYTYIFLGIDLKRSIHFLKKYSGKIANIEEPREIPINYTVKNCHTANVTLRQTLLDFFNKSIINGKKLEETKEKMTNLAEFYKLSDEEFAKVMKSKRYKSTSKCKLSKSFGPDKKGALEQRILDDIESISVFSNIPSSKGSFEECNDLLESTKSGKLVREKDIIVRRNNFDILKHGYDQYSQVYSVEASYLSDFLNLPIQDTNRVVIRIHGPWYYLNDDFILYDKIFKTVNEKRN